MSKIVKHDDGMISFEGVEATTLFRMMTLLKGLKFEHKFPGARLTGKAPKCSTIVKAEFGLKGRHPKLIEQFEKLVEEAKAAVAVERKP